MPGRKRTLKFPRCCAHCPHRDAKTASCGHILSQSIILDLLEQDDPVCPVFVTARAEAFRELSDALADRVESEY